MSPTTSVVIFRHLLVTTTFKTSKSIKKNHKEVLLYVNVLFFCLGGVGMTKISYHCMHNLIEQYILNVTNAPVTSTMIFNISFLTHYVIRLPLFQESKQKSIRKSHWNHFQILAFKNISFSYTSVSLNGSKVNRGQISSLCHTEAIRNVILLCSVMYSASECLPPEEQTHV